ncbi:MAG: hypothetical protein CM1200mP30_06420 [Pseudomonadota bacterium]|nr:MAG: hypothetical protein CM1200mP30_06420 [Pseudomonadota bacterium]
MDLPAMVLLPWSFSESWFLSTSDWALLFVLGVVCTVGGARSTYQRTEKCTGSDSQHAHCGT